MAQINASVVVLIIGILIIAVILVSYFYFRKKNKSFDEIQDDTLMINFDKRFTKGHGIGFEQKVQQTKSGRSIIDFQPIDLRKIKKDGEIEYELQPSIKMVVNPKDRILLGRGTISDYRETTFIFPKDQAQLDEIFRGTILGQLINKGIVFNSMLNKIFKSNYSMNEEQQKILKKVKGGEISVEKLTQMEEATTQMLKIFANIQSSKSSITKKTDEAKKP